MKLGATISKLRSEAGLTQAQFSEIAGVSQQSVQKWENDLATPDLERLVLLAKYFDVSLDALILGNDNRIVEEMGKTAALVPQYKNMHDWELYSSQLRTEYKQSMEEGLDVERYGELFHAAARLPKSEIKERLGGILFELICAAGQREDYRYVEPSELEQIRALRAPCQPAEPSGDASIEARIRGAWLGRICGCMLGKTVEGIRTNELIPFLKETGNYPMHRYILRKDLAGVQLDHYKYNLASRIYADEIDGMPVDDDTNYTVLAQRLIERRGRDFTPFDVSRAWLSHQSKDAYCTAERVAFCNFIKGYLPPQSALYKNPFREWIGAQIRGDYYGYINPGNPELAAEMAWRDASISHVKNGIYGEMLIAAMLATAAVTCSVRAILEGGLAQIPRTSRLYERVGQILALYDAGEPMERCLEEIHKDYDEHSEHGWCHTIPNAMIVAMALLYGEGDYGRSVCLAVQAGYDTDCNGATVGSVFGMAHGADAIPEEWTAPIRDTLHTSIFGVGTVSISNCVKKTMEHLKKA